MSTAAILAGGKSSRMGTDKLVLDFEGKSLLQSAVDRFSASFDKVFVCVADAAKYPGIAAEKAEDIYKGFGPMAGLHAAFLKTRDEGVFLAAADMPFSDPAAALEIIKLCGVYDACVFTDEFGRFEPLFAYYKKTLLPSVEKALSENRRKMLVLFEDTNVKTITKKDLGALWNDKLLMNVNRMEDYQNLINKGR